MCIQTLVQTCCLGLYKYSEIILLKYRGQNYEVPMNIVLKKIKQTDFFKSVKSIPLKVVYIGNSNIHLEAIQSTTFSLK